MITFDHITLFGWFGNGVPCGEVIRLPNGSEFTSLYVILA
jgi:hypothetical protein